jgi:hypothetical protein
MPIIEGFTPSGRSQNEAPRALEGFTSVYKVPMRGGDDASGMRNPLQFLNDTVVTTVNSGLGIIKGVSDFVSVDNPLSKGLEYIIKEGEETYSPQVKQAEEELGQAMDEGGFEAVKGVGKYVLSSPVQTAAKIVGGIGPIGKGIQASRYAAQALKFTPRGQGIAGVSAGATLGGAAAGGDAASDAYSQVMNSPNVPEDQREAMARQAARQASVVPAILGGLSGATGLERIMSGARGITREGVRRTAGKEFLTEGIEEGGTKASANIAAMQYDPTIDPMRGVVGATTLGGIMGAGGGAGVAYLNNRAYESNILGTANPSADQSLMLGINKGAGLSTQELINVKTGVTPAATKAQRAAREADIKAALSEPSGRYVTDENGIERELTMGEAASLGYETPALGALTSAEAPSGETTSQVIADDLQAAASKVGISLVSRGKPVQKRIDAFTKAVDLLGSGAIDKATFDQTIEQLKKNRYAEINKSFAQIEADFQEKQRLANQPKFQRAPKPEDQNVSTDISATGGLAPSVDAGGVDVSGGLAATGSALNVGPSSDVGSRVAGISPAGNETSLLGNVTGKSPTTLTLRAGAPASGMAQTSLEDQLAIGELTGNAAEAQALTEEEAGQRMDVTDTDESRAQDINAILDKAFENSEDKARDIEIAKMYLEVMKNAPQGFKQKIQTAIGKEFGVKAGAVRKIGQTPALVDAAVSMGMTRQQALDLLEISDTSKNKVSTTAGEQAGGLETVATELGVDFQENDSIGFGYDDTRTWSQSVKGAGDTVNATDEAMANAIYTISEKIRSVDALADKLPAIAGTLREMKAKLEETLVKTMQNVAGRLKPGSKPTPRKTKAKEVVEDETKLLTDEQVALNKQQEARQAARAASRKGLEVGDTVQNPKLGTGTVQSFSGDGDATMAKIAFQSGQTKDLMLSAAKLEKIASAPVTEKAPIAETTTPKKTKAGKTKAQVTGRDVWENLQKDTPGLGDYDGLSKREKDYVEEVAARTNGDFTLVSEPSMEVVIDNHINEEQTEDIYTEDFEADDGTARYMRSATSQEWKDNDGKTFKTQPTTLANLSKYPGVLKGLKHLQEAGLISTAQNIDTWLITDAKVPWTGMHMLVDGKDTIIFTQAALDDVKLSFVTLTHEIGHSVDEAGLAGTGIYSSAPELNLTFKNGNLKAIGPVTRELVNHFLSDQDSPLSEQLQYPLVDNDGLTADNMREELFAQLYMFSSMKIGRQYLRDNLPLTAAFMERTHAKIKKTNASAQPAGEVQSGESGQVQDRAQIREVSGRQLRANKEKIVNSKEARTVSSVVSETLNALMFTEDLFKKAVKSGIKSAKDMMNIYRERTNLEGQIQRDVERVASLYNKIPTNERGTGDASANRFVYDMTREKKWGFKPTWRTGQSGSVTIDPAMRKRWDGLSQESRDWTEAVFAHGDAMLKLKKQTLMDATNSEYDSLIKGAQAAGNTAKVAKFEAAKKSQLKQFARLFAVSEFAPYAPMKRFGDHVVVAKSQKYINASEAEQTKLQNDPDHYHVSFAESNSSAFKLESELRAEGSFANVETFKKEDAGKNGMYGGLLQAFTKLRGDLDSELANATDPAERNTLAKARAVVADLYLASLAENSARKSEMRRKGVAGEIDMLRSFATQGRADAQFLATAKYTPQMTEAINKMRREVKDGGSRLDKSQLFNEIMARHNQSLTYDASVWSDIAAKASRVTSVWFLATSPMYYLQNLTQPQMISVPFMAGRHNYFKTQTALIKAYTQLGGLNKNKKIDEPFDFNNVPADVRTMISTLVDRGRIDIGMETELGQFQVEGESKAAQGINKVDRVLRSVGQKMEAINRVSTAIAAYRLELAKTGDVKKATEYADEVISQTHGDYTRNNAPRAFNTNVGKVALQFRKFQLIQLTLLTKLVANSVKGATKEERVAARTALAFTLGHTAALAGLVGMPGFAAISFILKGLADMFGDDEEPYNLEKELYEAMVSQFGEDAATLITRGAPAAAGVDLSGKLGMGNTLSVLPFTDFELSKAGVAETGFAAVFGASGALAQRFAEGLKQISGGEYYRGLEKLAPKGFSDAMKAVRENEQGVTRLNGDVLVPADEIAAWESTAKFFGVPVTSDTKRRFLTDIKFENEKAFKDKAAKLKNQYTKARREGDDTTAVREKWAKLQDERVSEGFKREPLSNLLQAPQAQAKRERETAGGIQFNKQTRRFTEELVGEQ